MIDESTTYVGALSLEELESQLAEPIPARELMGGCGRCDRGLRVSVSVCLSLGASVKIG